MKRLELREGLSKGKINRHRGRGEGSRNQSGFDFRLSTFEVVSEHWTALANWRGAGIAEEAQWRNCPHPKAEVANQPHLPSHSQNHSSQVKSQSLSTLLITSKREESSYQLFLSRQLKRAAIEIEAVFRPQIHPLSIQEASRFKVPFTTGTFQSNTFQSIMVDHRQSLEGQTSIHLLPLPPLLMLLPPLLIYLPILLILMPIVNNKLLQCHLISITIK